VVPLWRAAALMSAATASSGPRRPVNCQALARTSAKIAFTSAGREWTENDAHGLIWAPVAELPEVAADETVRALGSFEAVTTPDGASYETLAAPFTIRGADVALRGPAPAPGSHTHQVLEEHGLTAEEIADLASSGVLG